MGAMVCNNISCWKKEEWPSRDGQDIRGEHLHDDLFRAGYCQACYMKSVPKRRKNCLTTSSCVDTTHIFNFYRDIHREFSPIFCFFISWTELFFQLAVLCLIFHSSVNYVKVFSDPAILKSLNQQTVSVSLPWRQHEPDILPILIFAFFFILAFPLSKFGRRVFKRDPRVQKYIVATMQIIVVLTFFARLVSLIILMRCNFNKRIAETWIKWRNTHPQGISGLMSATSACIVAFTLWVGHTGNDNRRAAFVIPFICVLFLGSVFTASYIFLVEIALVKNSTYPVVLTILKQYSSQRSLYTASSVDIFILLTASFIIYEYAVGSIEVISCKLGRAVRVDMATIQIKPKCLKAFVWFLLILSGLFLQFLCGFDELMALVEALGLFLISATFVITIFMSYKCTKDPKYQLLRQQDHRPSVCEESTTVAQEADPVDIESSGDSDTDIDAVVEEYKSHTQIQTFGDMSGHVRHIETNKCTFLTIKLITNASIFLSLVAGVVFNFVQHDSVIMGVLIAYILIAVFLLLLAIKQPQNDTFHPKLPLMPSLPLLCINICIVLLPSVLKHIWPVPFSIAFIGLVTYVCTSCFRRGGQDFLHQDDEFHQHSICLQPLPSHSANLQLNQNATGGVKLKKKKRGKLV